MTGQFSLILLPLEVLLALGGALIAAYVVCVVIFNLVKWAGKKYFDYFFKNPGTLSVRILGAQINLKVAGVVFIFLSIVIVLTILYGVLRMIPGRP